MATWKIERDYWRSTGRLRSIDVLRGAAAMAVVLVHIKHFRPGGPMNLRFWLLLPLEFGVLGVPLFVVLSGFCIHLAVAKQLARTGKVEADWLSFWRRRFYRLYPPYLAAIALGLAGYFIAKPGTREPFQTIANLPFDIVTHCLMVANLFEDYWSGVGNFPLWTLCMEEQLYLLYAAYIVFRRAVGVRVLFVALVVTASWKLVHFHQMPPTLGTPPLELGQWDKWPFDYWFNWVVGAIAAEAYAGAIRLPNWCYSRAWLLGAAAVGVVGSPILIGRLAGSAFLNRLTYGDSLSSILESSTLASSPALAAAFFIWINRWVRLEKQGGFNQRYTFWLASVGLFSYSLYLTHIPVLNFAEHFLRLDDEIPSLAFRYSVFPVLCLAAAYLFYGAVESRFLNRPSSQKQPTASLTEGVLESGDGRDFRKSGAIRSPHLDGAGLYGIGPPLAVARSTHDSSGPRVPRTILEARALGHSALRKARPSGTRQAEG